MQIDNLDAFTRAYITAAIWTECGPDSEDMSDLDESDLAPETLAKMVEDCAKFQLANAGLLKSAYALEYNTRDGKQDYSDSQAGHDFWLTRCGHGAGFWDRGLGEIGEALSKACGFRTAFDNVDLYLGDDGKIYQG